MTTLSLEEMRRDQQCIPDLVMARDYGPDGMTASAAMNAANLLDAVRAANAPRLTVRLALVAGLLSHLDLMEPEETTEP